MIGLLWFALAVACCVALFGYLQGWFINRVPEWFNGLPLAGTIILALAGTLWMFFVTVLPPTPMIVKEDINGTYIASQLPPGCWRNADTSGVSNTLDVLSTHCCVRYKQPVLRTNCNGVHWLDVGTGDTIPVVPNLVLY